MAGTSYLPVVVEVAFGANPLDTGTLTWTDISDYVRRGTGLDFSRGTEPETGEVSAGRLTFTVNNESGDFTPGETGSLGLIRNRLPVRVSAVIGTGTGNALTYDDETGWYDMAGATYDDTEIGTVVLWTGLVESWRIGWENGLRSQVDVTCVDRWAAIRRTKFQNVYATLVKEQGATALWPLTEAAGSTRATDLFGSGLTDMGLGGTPAVGAVDPGGPLGAVVFAADTLTSSVMPTAQTVALAQPDSSGASSGLLLTTQVATSATAVSFSGWVKVPRDPDVTSAQRNVVLSSADGSSVLSFTWTTGNRFSAEASTATESLTVTSASGSAPAGQWAHVALTLSISGGQGTLRLYVNGVQSATAPSTLTWAACTNFYLYAGYIVSQVYGPVALSHFALWSSKVLSTAEVLAQYQTVSMNGWQGETAAARAARLLTYVTPAPSLSTSGTFTATMSKQDVADKSLADALQECATAERGTLYMSTAGWPVLTSRSWRTGAAVAFTIPARALAADVAWTLDDQQLVNSATVDRMALDQTAATVKARNETSVTTYGEQTTSVQTWLDTDAQALERVNAEANMWATPLPRSSELSVDLMTKGATISAATLLGADIGQRVAVSGMPSEAPAQTQFFIEQISDRITEKEWLRTFTVSPRLDYFTVQNSTFGALDSTNVLAF